MRHVYLILVSCLLLTTTVHSQTELSHEQVLVPFDTMLVSGAGAPWSAELRVRNSSDVAVNLFPEQCWFIGEVTRCERKIVVPPNTAQVLDVLSSASLDWPGILLYVPSTHVNDVHFSLNVRDSRSRDSVGTTVPVVRRRDFAAWFSIPGIPIAVEHRRTLRVYDPQMPTQSVFRVRVIDDATSAILFERDYFRALPTDPPIPAIVPATFDFSDALSADALGSSQHVTVVIERVFPEDLPFWPLISVTSNQDNRVAVYAPN